ncbi:hypothetical protein FZI85_29975 [Mycobacterium sp. CBMA293]|nr:MULTISPECIES: hypothetical protein [unclassified Mycolicibacterium]MUL62734.1 hypothetical protein [Mycolicibacterium sp. CBMA 335]MUL69621.1 hypothetical protein [Mycolicibacterium sp. CBMA 311]MUM05018.1 hypothetical protein [Mycolicibacterium sp. CBMA 213]MUM15221.1 hypothetical protein [Mycolicibacterium sp. CBMA 293]MUL50065.1 hypothetical protein [Mycolicibacterium sp. CBMA 360]
MQVTATIQTVSTPPWPAPPARPRTWPAYALSAIAIALAVVALLTRLAAPAPPAPAAYSAADTAAAQQRLCDAQRLSASEIQADAGQGADKALARIATLNAAVMLNAAADSPALDAKLHDAAQALAFAYTRVIAMGSAAVATDSQYQAALTDSVTKANALRDLCNA